MFAVVRVNRGVEWVKGGFTTYDEAQVYINSLNEADRESQDQRRKYNEEFIGKLKLPDDPVELRAFIKDKFDSDWRGCTKGSLKTMFKMFLGNKKYEAVGYDPPIVTWDAVGLHVLEVKE